MSERPVIIPIHTGETPVPRQTDDDFLVGDLHKGGVEAVVILPGWGGTRYGPQRILVQTARAAAERGFTTLRLDFHGRGDSPGEAGAATLDTMIADTVAAIEWLRAEQGVGPVHLVGICSGGNVALGAASLLDNVSTLVCWSLLPLMEHKAQAAKQGIPRTAALKKLLRKALSLDTWRRLLRGEASMGRAVQAITGDKEGDAEERGRKTSARDILGDLETRFTGEVRLIYGTQDPEAAGSRAFFSAWCETHQIPLQMRIIEGAPHNYYTAQWTAEVVETTVGWLSQRKNG